MSTKWDIWGPDPEVDSGFARLWTFWGTRQQALDLVVQEQTSLIQEYGLRWQPWDSAREKLPWPYSAVPYIVVPHGTEPSPTPDTLGYTEEDARRALQSLAPGERLVFQSRLYKAVLERRAGVPTVTIQRLQSRRIAQTVSASGHEAARLLVRFWKNSPALVPEALRRFLRNRT